MPYTGSNKGNNGHSLGIITNSHILKVAPTICSLQIPISILDSNRNSTGEPPLLRSHIILVCWLGFKSQPFIKPLFFYTLYGPFPSSLVA